MLLDNLVSFWVCFVVGKKRGRRVVDDSKSRGVGGYWERKKKEMKRNGL
jgi:hypothetical protein